MSDEYNPILQYCNIDDIDTGTTCMYCNTGSSCICNNTGIPGIRSQQTNNTWYTCTGVWHSAILEWVCGGAVTGWEVGGSAIPWHAFHAWHGMHCMIPCDCMAFNAHNLSIAKNERRSRWTCRRRFAYSM